MKALALLLVASLCVGSVHSQDLNQLGAGPSATAPAAATDAPTLPAAATTPSATVPAAGTAAADTAPALGPSTKPAAGVAPAKPAQTEWVQRDGYVPLPKIPEQPADPPAKAPALPPANNFGAFTSEPPPADPTGTNVFSDPKYAPAAVQAAYEAEQNIPQSNLPSTMEPAAAAPAGALGNTMPPTAPSSDSMFSTPQNGGAGIGGMTPPSAGSDSVFANTGNGFNNRYTPSVGNAMGSSDIVMKMVVDAPEQQVAASGDVLRGMLANATQTPAARIFVFQTRTINSAAGQPSLDLSLLFKNDRDVDRTRQLQVLTHGDVMNRFTADVARQTGLKINPASIKTSSAVNDGGAMPGMGAMPAVGGIMMPGQMPGALPGMMPMLNATAMPADAAAAAPAPANAAGKAVVQLGMPLLVLAALAVL